MRGWDDWDAGDVHWARPTSPVGTGVLVLAGSSGRLDAGRADVLAAAGATAVSVRWFGGRGRSTVPCEVPLETFVAPLDALAAECDRVAVLGLSYGAEAALATACLARPVDAVVALAPTDVVWEGQRRDDVEAPRSKWTWRGEPLPFVALDRSWRPAEEPPSFVDLYERSRLVAGPAAVEAARIPVERHGGAMVLVAGGDDRVWPSGAAAAAIEARRAAHGLPTTVVLDERAGHPVVLPGEVAPDPRRPYRVGGDDGAPERLGARAWPAVREVLGLR